MDKKKTKMKIIIAVAVVVLVIAAAIGYMIVKDLKQEDILRDEIAELSKKDIMTARYNTPIKTNGDYAVVEKTIKEYLDDYSTTLKSVLDIMEDKQLANLLSADNYKSDGPDFVKSKEYLTKTKNSFNEKLTKLTKMTSEKEIMKKIKSQKLNSYYIDLYEELMLRGVAESDFKESQDELKTASEKINNLLDTQSKIIDLLISSKGTWSVEGDKVVFQSTDTLNKYNELIGQLSK